MSEIGVYVLTHSGTGKIYVGSSGQLTVRLDRHFRELKLGTHHNKPLQDVWNRHPWLLITLFPTETREEAYALEKELIDKNRPSGLLLNVGSDVRGGDNLTHNPDRDEIVKKRVAAIKARYSDLTDFDRKLIWGRAGPLNGMYGRTHTPEAKVVQSARAKGNRYSVGRKASDETKKKLSESASKRVGEKNPFYGKQHSEETKKTLSAIHKALRLKPANSRKVVVGGVVYESLTEASRQLGISPALMIYRLKGKSKKHTDYHYID